MTKPLNHKQYGDQIRGLFDRERFNEWKQARQDEKQELYQTGKALRYINTHFYKYHQYLCSLEWREKRQTVLFRDNYICRCCKVEKAVDVHHTSYLHLFDEPLEDLISLCRKCHRNEHNLN